MFSSFEQGNSSLIDSHTLQQSQQWLSVISIFYFPYRCKIMAVWSTDSHSLFVITRWDPMRFGAIIHKKRVLGHCFDWVWGDTWGQIKMTFQTHFWKVLIVHYKKLWDLVVAHFCNGWVVFSWWSERENFNTLIPIF